MTPPRHAATDHKDQEILRLKRQLAAANVKTREVRAEERERFSALSAASKRFAHSMRHRMDERGRQQRRLDAQYAVGRVLEEARDLPAAGPEIFRALGTRLGWDAGVLWTVEAGALVCGGTWRSDGRPAEGFGEACRDHRFPRGAGLPGRVWQREEPCWVEDVLEDDGYPRREAAAAEGLRCALAFPIQDGGRLVGVFELLKREPSPVDEDLLGTAYLVGHQMGQFVERRRAEAERDRALFREQEARRQADTILESINDAFFAVDRDWRFTYVNHRTEESWRRSRGYLLGKNLWEEFSEAVGSDVEHNLRRAMEGRETVGFETVSPASRLWVSMRAYPSAEGLSVYFQDISERKGAEAERDKLLAREWVASAEAAERERISRDLHDRVAHSLGVAHQSLQLYEVLADKDAARAAEKLELAKEMTKTSLESTRNLSAELRQLDAEEGLEAELDHLLDIAVPPQIGASLRVEGEEAAVPGHVRGQLFLILREAVRNAVVHSGCDSIAVGLDVGPGGVVGRVEDDGRGFDTTNGHTGVGLRSMRERAALLDGTLEVSCHPGKGTLVEVAVPLGGGR